MPGKVAMSGKSCRVLFTCEHLEIGGFGTHTICFGRALRRRGNEVGALVAEPFGALYPDFLADLDHLELLRRGLETRRGYLRRTVDCLRELKPDVLINSGCPFVQAALPFLPTEMVRLSVVHSITPREVAIGLANPGWLDAVIAVSENVRSALKAQNTAGVPLALIPVALDLPRAVVHQHAAVGPLRLIFVGRLWPEKNIPGLVRILALLHAERIPFSMTVVGDGPELPSARALVESSPFSRQVKFLGARRPAEVHALLDQHDFLLLTSHYEGTPHAVIEAMAHGLVVLASRIPGSTDKIIINGETGFLCDREAPGDYVSVLRRFAANGDDFRAVSRAARETVSARYDSNALAFQYESLFVRSKTRQRGTTLRQKEFGVSPSLIAFCPGYANQCRHRLADLWRCLCWGKRPVATSSPRTGAKWSGSGVSQTASRPAQAESSLICQP